MLADNIVLLKKRYPDLYRLVVDREEKSEPIHFFIEKAKDGNDTLKYQTKEQTMYLHSKYDPVREAESIVDKLVEQEAILEDTQIVFYGLGLGYHIEAFIKRFPETAFIIIEPSVELLSIFLERKLLKNLALKNLKLIQCGNDGENLFNQIIQTKDKHLVICEHPVYPKIFKQDYQGFLDNFKTIIKKQRSSLLTNYAYKKRWVINSVNNFKFVLTTPNILMGNNDLFKGKTAILVAAGPSLDYEIDNLRRIKEEGLAYIFAVGSAINSLIENDIYPDAMCTYDPQGVNQQVFKKLNERGVNTIPMIFGSSVGFETLQQYSGPKFHMITSQDTVSKYFLKDKNYQELVVVKDAPSIAVLTLELLEKMEFDKIVLVGQNLGFKGDTYYASGIDYGANPASLKSASMIEVIDVDGNKMLTNEALNQMKLELEARIATFGTPVINTTIGGAAIKGTSFEKLDKVIDVELKTPITVGVFDQIKTSNNYDEEFLFSQFKKLKIAYEVYREILLTIKQLIIKTDELVRNKNLNQSENMYIKIDHLLDELERNDFAKVFEIPMNRVEHEILAYNLQRIQREQKGLQRLKEKTGCLSIFINHMLDQLSIDDGIILNLENDLTELKMKNTQS